MSRSGPGLVIVYTGQGKGKTTAALGLALRACGHGLRVLMIQFIKQSQYGEHRAVRYIPNLEIRALGEGFTIPQRTRKPVEVHREAVRRAWSFVRERVSSGGVDLLILDEVNYVLANPQLAEVLSLEEVLAFLRERPPALHVVLTGRGAPPALVDAADLVTEMVEVKHPYRAGVPASKGIEF